MKQVFTLTLQTTTVGWALLSVYEASRFRDIRGQSISTNREVRRQPSANSLHLRWTGKSANSIYFYTTVGFIISVAWQLAFTAPAMSKEGQRVSYNQQIAPILKQYCLGCHNADDREGDLSLESYADIQKANNNGPIVLAGQPDSSRIVRSLVGQTEPVMPPEDNPKPTKNEIAMIREWIKSGARGPDGQEPGRTQLITPDIAPIHQRGATVTSLAWSLNNTIAAGAFKSVQLSISSSDEVVRTLRSFSGKVNDARFRADGRWLVTASGITGLFGEATIWDVADGRELLTVKGHRDVIYAAVLDPTGTTLATAGYDHRIILWDAALGTKIRTLDGHNGAIYDLAFSPDGTVLVSASADETVKLWLVSTGLRLDTRSQPTAEQYTVEFSPDSQFLLAGGADNRIRVWRFVSRRSQEINPMVMSRFAHEGAITQLAHTHDGKYVVTAADDRSVKVWHAGSLTQTQDFETQPDVPSALAVSPTDHRFIVGRMDGSRKRYTIDTTDVSSDKVPSSYVRLSPEVPEGGPTTLTPVELVETEPNELVEDARSVSVPVTIRGVIDGQHDGRGDWDLFRFSGEQGRTYIIETKADRLGAPLDTRVQILDSQERRIPRVQLQAVRDTYYTFRGIDSQTSDSLRLHLWRELELNEYLYTNGEVVRLWHYPRGPDSGFRVYPGLGTRHTFFGTTATTHALGEPCYIVEPHDPRDQLLPNGLPVFTIYFENDDGPQRKIGPDSHLQFTAPNTADFLVRLDDSRAEWGSDFRYELTIRHASPDFRVSVGGMNPTVNRGSGKEISFTVDRIDGYQGEVRIDINGVPPGFEVTSPIVVEANQHFAYGTIFAAEDASEPTLDNSTTTRIIASATINGHKVEHALGGFGEIKLADPPKLQLQVLPVADDDTGASSASPLELVIEPGTTIAARVKVTRNDFDGRVRFGSDDSGRNLPHGVYVDNIGLNGLLIVEGAVERTFFISAAKWVPETKRLFHLRTTDDGGQAARPVLLHVQRSDN